MLDDKWKQLVAIILFLAFFVFSPLWQARHLRHELFRKLRERFSKK